MRSLIIGCFYALTFPLGLTGCMTASQRHANEVKSLGDMYRDSVEECRYEFPEASKKYVEFAKCQNQSMELLRLAVPFPDLLDQEAATRLAIAEKVQSGKITLAEGNMQASQVHSQIVAEEQRRSLAGRAVSAQETAAIAAWAGTGPVVCNRIGTRTICN